MKNNFSFITFSMIILGLVACGQANEEGNSIGDSIQSNDYKYIFESDPDTFDYLYTFNPKNNRHLANFVDGLLEHDEYGNLVASLANEWESNEDSSIWTFKLKEGVNWVTDEGEVYAELTANDFVTGLQHAADFDSETLYLVQDLILGLDGYIEGTLEFDEVGIKAIDDYTLEYSLTTPTPYFDTLTTYSILLPVNEEFLSSQGSGCQLGAPEASTCQFGSLNSDSILYNGAYRLVNYISKSQIEYVKNEEYWDADSVYIPKVKLVYYDGSDAESLFQLFEQDELSAIPVNAGNAAIYKAAKERYEDSIYITDNTSTTYYGTFIFDRNNYASTLDPNVDVSPKTEKQREDTKKAILNQSFRQSIIRALDTSALSTQEVGEELKMVPIRNTLTQPTFVTTSDGHYYGQLVASELQSLNPTLYGDNLDLLDGQMAYYDVLKAKELFADAKVSLQAEGVEFPIYLDLQVKGEEETELRVAQAFKQSIEETLNGEVMINLIMTTRDHIVANAKGADLMNTDIYFATMWTPDYGDPKTYVDILDPDNGDMLKYFGLNRTGSEVGDDAVIKKQIGLYEYQVLKDAATTIVGDLDTRYTAYAKAEAYAIDQGYFIPYATKGGSYEISKVIPYTRLYGTYGLSEYKYKKMQVGNEVIGKTEREEAKKQWESHMID